MKERRREGDSEGRREWGKEGRREGRKEGSDGVEEQRAKEKEPINEGEDGRKKKGSE